MNDILNQILGGGANVFPFPGSTLQQQERAFQQQAGLAALRDCRPVPVPTPEESKQHEIKRKNDENYARWLARMMREPLQDVPFR